MLPRDDYTPISEFNSKLERQKYSKQCKVPCNKNVRLPRQSYDVEISVHTIWLREWETISMYNHSLLCSLKLNCPR